MEVVAFPRSAQGTGASRRLRRSGKVPGIVYGGETAPMAIELDHNALYHHLKLEAFHASILSMAVAGKKEQVLLRDVQMHPFRAEVLHVDFQRVAQDKEIYIKVPLHFMNAEVAPGVKLSGGIVSHVMNDLEVVCLPKNLPAFIEVDLGSLDAGDSIHVSALKLPAGVEAVTIQSGEDPVVAACVLPRAAVEEEAEAAAPAAAAELPASTAKKEEKEPEKK
ncbi:MAG TPA: 50S ribosomal protein L25/general stress protein Ctc [Burkholderiales bacterium]|nr:50S ribosomal protein L25/general stress protein Ctc [Betaproteobacteria bacterium]HQR52284.1 50S ribosomal protein L25/general stress protein Ctc [Burkholderiales bacterium]